MKTNFDVITESPEKLAEILFNNHDCLDRLNGKKNSCDDCNHNCFDGMLNWLCNPAEEE